MCMDANLLHSQAKIASTVTIMPQEQTYYRKCRNCGPEYHMKFSKNEKISSLSGLFGIPSKSSIVVVVDYSPWSLFELLVGNFSFSVFLYSWRGILALNSSALHQSCRCTQSRRLERTHSTRLLFEQRLPALCRPPHDHASVGFPQLPLRNVHRPCVCKLYLSPTKAIHIPSLG